MEPVVNMGPIVITGLFLLSLKHLVVDFFLQTPYQYLNKGNYGHFGGVTHAYLHAIGTYCMLIGYVGMKAAAAAALFDAVTHYHIDYLKVRFCEYWEVTFYDEAYWLALGTDQFLHQVVYFLIVIWAFL